MTKEPKLTLKSTWYWKFLRRLEKVTLVTDKSYAYTSLLCLLEKIIWTIDKHSFCELLLPPILSVNKYTYLSLNYDILSALFTKQFIFISEEKKTWKTIKQFIFRRKRRMDRTTRLLIIILILFVLSEMPQASISWNLVALQFSANLINICPRRNWLQILMAANFQTLFQPISSKFWAYHSKIVSYQFLPVGTSGCEFWWKSSLNWNKLIWMVD